MSGMSFQLGFRRRTPGFASQVFWKMYSASSNLIEATERSGKSFFGGQFVRRQADSTRDIRLGDSKCGMDHCASEDLHGDGVGIRAVELPQVEHDLEIEEEPLDSPPLGVQGDGVFEGQTLRGQDVGHGLVGGAVRLQDEHTELERIGRRARLDDPVLGEPAFRSVSLEDGGAFEPADAFVLRKRPKQWFASSARNICSEQYRRSPTRSVSGARQSTASSARVCSAAAAS